MEIKQYQIKKIKYIKSIKNTWADTINPLVNIYPDIQLNLERDDQEYGYCIFEKLSQY